MSMNIKNKEAYRLTRQLSELTGESLTTAVTEAVRERLDRVRREQGVDLVERLLRIGRDCAAHLKATVPLLLIDHADMLYDDRGMPKSSSIPSAIIAILRDEAEAMSCARAISNATIRRVSAVNFVEFAVVIDAEPCDPIATRRFDDFIEKRPSPLNPSQRFRRRWREMPTEISQEAADIPLKLNFGDCFAYALANNLGEPLLFKGNDFAHTDIVAVQ